MSYTGIRRLPNAMLSIELKIMLHFLKTYSVNERKTVKHVVGKNNFFRIHDADTLSRLLAGNEEIRNLMKNCET